MDILKDYFESTNIEVSDPERIKNLVKNVAKNACTAVVLDNVVVITPVVKRDKDTACCSFYIPTTKLIGLGLI